MNRQHLVMSSPVSNIPVRESLLPIVSVIIPAYNAGQSLGNQLEALHNQNFEGEWEAIVIDNGSTDNTVSVVKNYQRIMPNLRLVQASERKNRSYARNQGVKAARGSLFLFCDADDVVSNNWITAMTEALQEHSVVICPAETRLLRKSAQNETYLNRTSLKDIYLDFLPVAMGCNSGVRRDAFEPTGGFSENFPRNQDVDLSWRLQLMGHEIYLTQETMIYYRPRNTYKGIMMQGFEVGMAQVNLYRAFAAHGMPKSSSREASAEYWQLIRELRTIHRKNRLKREQWVQKMSTRLGRILGSFRYRRFYI